VDFVLDSLSYPFALLMSLMGFLSSIYSHKYIPLQTPRYYKQIEEKREWLAGGITSQNNI